MPKTKTLRSARKLSKLQFGIIAGLLAVAGIIYVLATRAGGAGGVMPLDWALDAQTPTMSTSLPMSPPPYQACVSYTNTGTTPANFTFSLAPGVGDVLIKFTETIQPSTDEQVRCLEPSFRVPDGNELQVTAKVDGGSVYVGNLSFGVTAFTPQNLHSTSATTSSISLAWEGEPEDPCDENGCGAGPIGKVFAQSSGTRYRLYRSQPNSTTVTKLQLISDLTYTDSQLRPDTTYIYQVVAVDQWGTETQKSEPVVVATKAPVIDAQPPQGVTVSNLSETSQNISWRAPSSTSKPMQYRVHRLESPTCSDEVTCVFKDVLVGTTTEKLSLTSAGLVPNTNYQYYVVAAYGNGIRAKSSIASGTTPDTTPPTVPTGLKTIDRGHRWVSFSWAASSDNSLKMGGYYIYRDGKMIGNTEGGTDFLALNLKPGKTYKFQVAAYDDIGNTSAKSAAITIKTKAPDKKIVCGWRIVNGLPKYVCRPR